MVKNSAVTLSVLVVLVLVGAGVILLGPSLTGYLNIPQIDPASTIQPFFEEHYAINQSNNFSSFVLNPLKALGSNSTDYAVLQYSTSNSHFCPSVPLPGDYEYSFTDGGKWCRFNRNQISDLTESNYTSPKFQGWLLAYIASNEEPDYLYSTSAGIYNVTVQVNASNLNLGCTLCNRSTKYYIQYIIHSGPSDWSNLTPCFLAAGEKGKICSVDFLLGFNSSVSVLVARANLKNSLPDPAIHWIRLVVPKD